METKYPTAVIFDLDGVITDTAEYHYLAWKRLSDELGLYFDRSKNEELKGVSRLGSLDIILRSNGKLDAYSYEEKQELAEKKNTYYKEFIREITPEDTLPQIRELLQELRIKNIKTALASVSKNAYEVLDRLELTDMFDAIADPNKIKNSKPDPEIFRICAELLGEEFENCIGVEDSQAGIEAIHNAGMFSVGIGVTVTSIAPHMPLKSTSELSFDRIAQGYTKWSIENERI